MEIIMKMNPFNDSTYIASSTLKVVASELLDVSKDLENNQNKSIAEIINEKEEDQESQESQ